MLQKRFQETKAAGNNLDWDALQDFVTSDEGKRELAALRTTYIDLQSKGEGQKVRHSCCRVSPQDAPICPH